MVTPATPTESSIQAQLVREGLTVSRWSNSPHAVYAVHDHPYAKVVCVVSGSITLTVQGRGEVLLHPGDRLELPPQTPRSAVVGSQGVVCLEAHPPDSR